VGATAARTSSKCRRPVLSLDGTRSPDGDDKAFRVTVEDTRELVAVLGAVVERTNGA
jgi:hypothetical protein